MLVESGHARDFHPRVRLCAAHRQSREGRVLDLPTRLQVIKDEDAVVHLDGGNGLGAVAASAAMGRCIEKARTYGVGFALVS